ncbi:MAG: hypothetical protein JOY90_31720 [Bradyrhizobium sp.]|uniref:hypothetical protein n=1 Tax=Bradyrhizobium sp. TaxID=376 RepID=UPI001DA9F6AC|nr:hypothetical protein [Bradyrhizobium sp.]MBV9564981.1 hypothetical protein [Bradyrhizobium sp.]
MATNPFSILVRSEPGDAVQLSDFRPVTCGSLARVGGPYDGGYVVPLNAVTSADALLSLGLSHNWSFERDFRKHNPRAVIHCYDHTVSLRTAAAYSVGQLARFLARFTPHHLREALAWIDYLMFFRGDKVHFRQRIWHDRQNDSATIDDAFARLPASCQVFVKIDIENSEYRVLDDLLRRADCIVALAIEFHDVDIWPERFTSLVEKIKRDFYIVHFHANNMGGLAPFHFPIAPEITFLNKRFFDTVPAPSRLQYPDPELDRPNLPRWPDYQLEF